MPVTTNGAPVNTKTACNRLWQDVSQQHPDALSLFTLIMQPLVTKQKRKTRQNFCPGPGYQQEKKPVRTTKALVATDEA